MKGVDIICLVEEHCVISGLINNVKDNVQQA